MEFETWTTKVGSDRSTNWTTATDSSSWYCSKFLKSQQNARIVSRKCQLQNLKCAAGVFRWTKSGANFSLCFSIFILFISIQPKQSEPAWLEHFSSLSDSYKNSKRTFFAFKKNSFRHSPEISLGPWKLIKACYGRKRSQSLSWEKWSTGIKEKWLKKEFEILFKVLVKESFIFLSSWAFFSKSTTVVHFKLFMNDCDA